MKYWTPCTRRFPLARERTSYHLYKWQPFEYFRWGAKWEKLKRREGHLNLIPAISHKCQLQETYQVHPTRHPHRSFMVCVIIAALWMALQRNTALIIIESHPHLINQRSIITIITIIMQGLDRSFVPKFSVTSPNLASVFAPGRKRKMQVVI